MITQGGYGYLMKTKDQALEMFKEWKLQVKPQTEKKVKYFRSNNRLEICNLEFNQFCQIQGDHKL